MDASAAKVAVRDRLLTERRRRSLLEQQEAARSLAEHLLAWEPVRRAATVAAYASVPGEPGTGPLLDALVDRGRHVLLPVLRPDKDLDWARYDGELVSASRGLLEPPGERLGLEAIATADVVLVPALAVDRSGVRLGRGAGCYDRALGRVPVGTPVCALLHDGEVLDSVPHEPHDRAVTAVATPGGLTLLPSGR
jgi:5-formyltetrahydrofolate cyclo-ligase